MQAPSVHSVLESLVQSSWMFTIAAKPFSKEFWLQDEKDDRVLNVMLPASIHRSLDVSDC